jgi:hypothetical protein
MSLSETVNESYNKYKAYKTVTGLDEITFCWTNSTGYIFRHVGDEPLTEIRAQEIQLNGFRLHPGGHGFYRFSTKLLDGLFISSWTCSLNCE